MMGYHGARCMKTCKNALMRPLVFKSKADATGEELADHESH
jgi:hypothetical protein